MPITPYHFGPGAAIHSMAPRRISFLAFCVANVLTDVEPLYHILRHQHPIHGFFHTYLGATVTAAVTVAGFAAARVPRPNLRLGPVAVGALIGTWSHVLLDSLMASDVHPLAPFTDANPLLDAIPYEMLIAGCVISGGAGLILLAARRLVRREGPR